MVSTLPPLPISLNAIYLQNNWFNGTLPNLSTFSQLTAVWLYENQKLGGNFSLPPNIVSYNVYRTQIGGTLPTLPQSLRHIDVRWTNVFGDVPALPDTLESIWLSFANVNEWQLSKWPANLVEFDCTLISQYILCLLNWK